MRKLAVIAPVALALSMAIAGTAFAENDQSGQTVITASKGSGYTLTVPANTTIAEGATHTQLSGDLMVRGNIANNKKVRVTAAINGLKGNATASTIAYTLSYKDTSDFTAYPSGGLIWNQQEASDGKEYDLAVDITQDEWDKAPADQYTDTIVFTASLQDA